MSNKDADNKDTDGNKPFLTFREAFRGERGASQKTDQMLDMAERDGAPTSVAIAVTAGHNIKDGRQHNSICIALTCSDGDADDVGGTASDRQAKGEEACFTVKEAAIMDGQSALIVGGKMIECALMAGGVPEVAASLIVGKMLKSTLEVVEQAKEIFELTGKGNDPAESCDCHKCREAEKDGKSLVH